MADNHSAEVYLKPHIVKFLFVKLNDRTHRHTPHGDTISRELMKLLEPSIRLVEVQPSERHAKLVGKLRIGLKLSEDGELTSNANNLVALYAEKEYRKEFTRYVDEQFYRLKLCATKHDAIESFRSLYSITEDDLPMRASERNYQRHEKHHNRHLKRGGARPNSGPKEVLPPFPGARQ